MSGGTSRVADQWARKVPNQIRAVMAEQCVTAVDLMRLTGMPRSAYYRRMKGRKPFDVNELAIIAEMLRVPVGRLLP